MNSWNKICQSLFTISINTIHQSSNQVGAFVSLNVDFGKMVDFCLSSNTWECTYNTFGFNKNKLNKSYHLREHLEGTAFRHYHPSFYKLIIAMTVVVLNHSFLELPTTETTVRPKLWPAPPWSSSIKQSARSCLIIGKHHYFTFKTNLHFYFIYLLCYWNLHIIYPPSLFVFTF